MLPHLDMSPHTLRPCQSLFRLRFVDDQHSRLVDLRINAPRRDDLAGKLSVVIKRVPTESIQCIRVAPGKKRREDTPACPGSRRSVFCVVVQHDIDTGCTQL